MAATAPSRSIAGDGLATVAVGAFSIAVAAGFARVFSGWDFMNDFVMIVIVGHGAGFALRRLRVPGWAAVPIVVGVLVWAIAALYYRPTFSWGLPTSETWSVFSFEIDHVRDQFATTVAPVTYSGGWDVLAAIGLALAVFLADAFAFRAYARAETLVPGGVLFVFVGALGDDRLRVTLTMVLVAVGVITTVVLRSYHSLDGGRPGSAIRLRRMVPAAVAATVVIALGAGYLGPRVPGAHAEALYETRGGGGGVTELLSPLVDIRSRLTDRTNDEMFRVRADTESYWRLATLPEFDGTVWRLPDETLEPTGEARSPQLTDGPINRQTVTISGLGGKLVPAAPEPTNASPPDLGFDEESSTIFTVDDEIDDGDVFEIVSRTTSGVSKEQLESATSDFPGNDIYTDIPDDLPQEVTDAARRASAGSRNGFQAARQIQGWFRRDFTYSLDVQDGHGNSAIVNFLRDRVGYCEQFAGTFAAMMRTLGYPARVAVGYTSGLQVADGSFSVVDRNAHAWPEVWFDDIGWVLFEPTPGRGAPGTEQYTGIAPQQDVPTVEEEPVEDDEAAAPLTTTALPPPTPGLNIPDEFADPTGADETRVETPSGGVNPVPFVLLFTVVLIVAAPAIVRRFRSRARSSNVEAQLARIWNDSLDTVQRAGVPIQASDTPLETAAATTSKLPIVGRPFSELAQVVTEATYSGAGTSDFEVVGEFGSSTVRQCQSWGRQISRAVNDSSSLPQRVRRYFTVWH